MGKRRQSNGELSFSRPTTSLASRACARARRVRIAALRPRTSWLCTPMINTDVSSEDEVGQLIETTR